MPDDFMDATARRLLKSRGSVIVPLELLEDVTQMISNLGIKSTFDEYMKSKEIEKKLKEILDD